MMIEFLNKPEIEEDGAIIHQHLSGVMAQADNEEFLAEKKRLNKVLRKMDYPEFME